MNKGLIPIYILVVVVVFILVGVSIGAKKFLGQKQNASDQSEVAQEENESQDNNKNRETTPPGTSQSQKPGFQPTPSPTPQPKHRCEVHYTETSAANSADLFYGFIPADGTAYMTKARWDFNADGVWDTDLSQANGHLNHTFPSGGNYTVRLQLQASDGSLTEVCTKTITITSKINVSVSGQVFSDNNCNGSKDSGESGVPGVMVNIFKNPEYLLLGTVTSDGNGNYNFSKTISANESLSVTPSTVAASGYKNHPTLPDAAVGLSKSLTQATINLPQVPNTSVGQCSF